LTKLAVTVQIFIVERNPQQSTKIGANRGTTESRRSPSAVMPNTLVARVAEQLMAVLAGKLTRAPWRATRR